MDIFITTMIPILQDHTIFMPFEYISIANILVK